ncbi:MAG: zinc-ribbon domain-containing protein [Proteobacteria bacterium]|nr:zinc-ribbon domain-containing protein [Pseudomonadota bacterium]HQR03915.1 DUF3426 domain-containing protein [Rhodocyclaceae bacterium]
MMLTRCPDCATTFRVTPEQLKARHGKVRCGECDIVFNALESLVENLPVQPTTADQQISAAQPFEHTQPAPIPSPAVAPPRFDPPPPENTPPVPVFVESIDFLIDEDAASTRTVDFDTSAPPIPFPAPELPHSVEPDPVPVIDTDDVAPALAADTAIVDAVPDEAPAPEEPVDEVPSLPAAAGDSVLTTLPADPVEEPAGIIRPFIPPPFDPSLHRRTKTRPWGWIIGTTCSLICLLLQMTFLYRTEIAVLAPRLKPMLEAACKPLGCAIPLPRKPDLLSIEASDLHPDPSQPGHLSLSATLRNRAPFAQEYPLLEITLTDMTDKPLLVRSLKPAEYLPRGTDPLRGFAARADQPLRLELDASPLAAAGYRLYLYYP